MGKSLLILITWALLAAFAQAQEKSYGYSWKFCERKDRGGATIPFDENGKFRPECAPDTLYHWRSSEKVEALKPKFGSPNAISFDWLFTWRTPAGSHNYGNSLIRIKLKPGVKFVLKEEVPDVNARNCEGEESNTIHVGINLYGFSEYILCSPDVVESWSYGTPEIADEVERDFTWMSTHDATQFDDFFNNRPAYARTRVAGNQINSWNEKSTDGEIKADLDLIRSTYQNHRDLIYYAEGVPHDRARHYSTKIPSFFNPRLESDVLKNPKPGRACESPSSQNSSIQNCIDAVSPILDKAR